MIRHVVMFRLQDDAPEDTLASLEAGLAHLAATISVISKYSYGRDVGLREGNFDLAVVADFEDADAFADYVRHPEHVAFVEGQLTPHLAERVALQFELSPA